MVKNNRHTEYKNNKNEHLIADVMKKSKQNPYYLIFKRLNAN